MPVGAQLEQAQDLLAGDYLHRQRRFDLGARNVRARDLDFIQLDDREFILLGLGRNGRPEEMDGERLIGLAQATTEKR